MRSASSRLRIVVTGLVAQHPRLGGVAWDYLQYALGLAQLGHEVSYLEDSGQWAYTLGGRSGAPGIARDPRPNVAHLAKVMERFGLGERWAYRFPLTGEWFGLADAARREATGGADLLLDVSGSLERPEEHRGRGRLVYVDTDPVFTQLRLAVGPSEFAARMAGHDLHFSFGERMERLGIATAQRWRPTRQPVVLSEWQPGRPARKAWTTVLSWTSYPPLGYRGVSYGQKDVEFRRFLGLPERVAPLALEVAIGGTRHPDWEGEGDTRPPCETLRGAGFRVADAYHVCADLDRYRHYVETSRGEWSVQKNGYVRGQPGWFSCRSACYLAAGRPVVVQDTGLAGVLPTGDGLLAFRTLEEAAEALLEVEADYERHAAAAQALAAAYFDAELVLPALLEEALASDV
jgi:hypothetical protein